MNKNDIITLKIEDMGIDGEGIGKIDGMTFFVKDAVIGDEIEARITKLKKNYGYARVEQIVKPSGFRTEPKCELHRRCGGVRFRRWIMQSSRVQGEQGKKQSDPSRRISCRLCGFCDGADRWHGESLPLPQ